MKIMHVKFFQKTTIFHRVKEIWIFGLKIKELRFITIFVDTKYGNSLRFGKKGI